MFEKQTLLLETGEGLLISWNKLASNTTKLQHAHKRPPQGRIQLIRLGGVDFRNIWRSSLITTSLLQER